MWLGHDLTGYFKTAGVKQVRLDLIQGGDLGGGTAKIRIRYDPKQAVVADTWEDNPELSHAGAGNRRRGLRGADRLCRDAGDQQRLHPDHRRERLSGGCPSLTGRRNLQPL